MARKAKYMIPEMVLDRLEESSVLCLSSIDGIDIISGDKITDETDEWL